MRGLAGTTKKIGDRCAECLATLTQHNAVARSAPRAGLNSYCRMCMNARSVLYAQRNPAKRLATAKRERDRLKATVVAAYGGACACCGVTHLEFLAIDHVAGGGSKHRKTISSPTPLRRLIIKQGFPKHYRILCHNCNSAIGWFGRCPHAGP